ncbi:hypothetical protein PENANT_c001G04992 [Penicillium antarcticum]|uniref:Uncharacterized protein n=1 Tax=Penicillium antarcticum TaxID=416450 RepID=A0A1V6QMX5_9EURO|nr:uncharacterized protein N7508_010438 [Penicillium antarcticum]KAJ5295617.1 hypothetical protein N7508_010438 [Penicillium antarcticum]OQD90590.1 hypothetical protein PENANT_c001G04992 [Penicillium antarcticum]
MNPQCRIPIDILFLIANILPLEDLVHLLQAIPNLSLNLPTKLLKTQDSNGNTLLHHLASSNLYILATLLPKQHPQILNTPNYDGQTALHKAVTTPNQSLNITSYLLDNGADIQPRDNRDETPLHLTCRTPSPISSQILKIFLKASADPSPRSIIGFTPLHEAILAHQPPDTIRTLINAGADVNATAGRKRWTPLFYAVRFSIESPSEVLISAGADPMPVLDGNENENYQVEDRDNVRKFTSAARGRGIEILKTLLQATPNLQQRDIDGRTVFLETARVGADKALVLLLNAGACIHACDINRRDALCLAASMGHWSTAKKLVEAGVSVLHRDSQGRDAVDLAKWFGFEDLARMLRYEKRKRRPLRWVFGVVGWRGQK